MDPSRSTAAVSLLMAAATGVEGGLFARAVSVLSPRSPLPLSRRSLKSEASAAEAIVLWLYPNCVCFGYVYYRQPQQSSSSPNLTNPFFPNPGFCRRGAGIIPSQGAKQARSGSQRDGLSRFGGVTLPHRYPLIGSTKEIISPRLSNKKNGNGHPFVSRSSE